MALLVAGLVATPAFRSARYTRRQVDVLLDDRKREAYERKSMQASQFAVWLDMDAPGELVLHGMNSSSLPIFDATSRIVGEEGIVYETNNPVVRPHPTPIVLKHLNALSRETQLEIVKVMRDDAAVAVDVTFRDNANVSWRRHRGGLLVEIDRQANPSGEATTDEPPS